MEVRTDLITVDALNYTGSAWIVLFEKSMKEEN